MTEFRNLIDGEWIAGTSATPNRNPSDLSDVVGDFHQADASQANAAIAAARSALSGWSHSPILVRAQLLRRVAGEIEARVDELADLLAREEGKALRDAKGEVARAAQIFDFFAGEALRLRGDALSSTRPGVEVQITREPVGVVTVITPWNFPIAIPAWKIAPALAFGNTVVFKPADPSPGCAWALVDIIQRAGCPPGVLNLVMRRGSVIGDALTGRGVDAISFTGSTSVGTSILAAAAQRRAKVQLEMGGKNPLVVLDDADLDTAVRIALDGAFFATGQRCTASSRLIVQSGIHDRFVAALSDAVVREKVGDARAPDTTIGPVADARQFETDLHYIAVAEAEGARLFTGGERLERATHGHFLSPALFVDTTRDMRINQEEVFGPVASVIRVSDYEEALDIANDVEFGLCAGIATTSLKHATHFRRNAEVGMVMVNLPTAGVDPHVPFGGRKASSYGPREQGAYAAEFYTAVKTAYLNAG